MGASGSDSGISFILKPVGSPMDGWLQVTRAFSPVLTSIVRLVGGSGTVMRLAVQVNLSDIELFE